MRPHSPSPARQALVERLAALFRDQGYDGVSIGDVCVATGLGRSSLYHHFPGGKEEMADAVADLTLAFIAQDVTAPLRGPGPLASRVDCYLDRVARAFSGGAVGCVIASLLAGAPGDALAQRLRAALDAWIEAMAAALREAGLEDRAARSRAQEALALIQGGLVLARGLRDQNAFAACLIAARERLLPAP